MFWSSIYPQHTPENFKLIWPKLQPIACNKSLTYSCISHLNYTKIGRSGLLYILNTTLKISSWYDQNYSLYPVTKVWVILASHTQTAWSNWTKIGRSPLLYILNISWKFQVDTIKITPCSLRQRFELFLHLTLKPLDQIQPK